MKEIINVLIDIYLLISPLVIYYLYEQLKSISIDNEIKSNIEEEYGSIKEYVKCVSKDFDTIRNVLKSILSYMNDVCIFLTSLVAFVDNYDMRTKENRKILLDRLLELREGMSKSKKEIECFIEKEREAHETK